VTPPRDRLRAVLPRRDQLGRDAVAGVPGAIAGVPDGMAASVLVGVSPIHGLIASFIGPIAGGLTASTALMVITTTSASAMAAGSVLTDVASEDRENALFLLTALAGAFMIAARLLRLGRYTRFVSHSVMMGFLTGVALNIIFGQIPDLTGTTVEGESALAKALAVVTDPQSIDGASLLIGLAAMVILVGLKGTRLGSISSLIALVIPTALAALADLDVARVSDLGDIPQGVPLPEIPELGLLSVSLVTGALSVAVIVLVQGAGVGQSVTNPDGTPSDASGDFAAQGWGNVASVPRGSGATT
jgi:sulfate permease, SulP family